MSTAFSENVIQITRAMELLRSVSARPLSPDDIPNDSIRALAMIVSYSANLLFELKQDKFNSLLNLSLEEVGNCFHELAVSLEVRSFDMAAARSGRCVKTADGRPARIVCYDADNSQAPLVVLVRHHNNEFEELFSYKKNGRMLTHVEGTELVMV